MPRIVSLDVGDTCIGVAVSDERGVTANPVCTIRRGRSIKADVRAVEQLLAQRQAERVVVGLPLTQHGEVGPQAAKVKDFAERLARRIRIPLEYWDERFSTQEAEEALIQSDVSRAKRKKVIDQAAAVVILVEVHANPRARLRAESGGAESSPLLLLRQRCSGRMFRKGRQEWKSCLRITKGDLRTVLQWRWGSLDLISPKSRNIGDRAACRQALFFGGRNPGLLTFDFWTFDF